MDQITRECFGNSNEHYRFYTLDTFISNQVRFGYRQIHLFGGTPHVWIDAYRHDDAGVIRAHLQDAGLSCVSFTIETSSMRYSLPRIREADGKSRNYFDFCYAYAAELGVQTVITAANGFCLDESPEARREHLLEVLREETARAREFGLCLAVVNRGGDGTNLVQSLSDAQHVRQTLGEESPCFVAETAYFYENADTLGEWMDALGACLVQVNLTNTLFDGARHAWGDGYLNLADMIGVLKEKRFDHPINCGCMVRHYMQNPWIWDEHTAQMINFILGSEKT